MKVDSGIASLASGINSRTAEDRSELLQIGRNLKSAENQHRLAMQGGNQGEIAAAQMGYEKAAQALKAKIEMQSSINRLINSIIDKLGQIGR